MVRREAASLAVVIPGATGMIHDRKIGFRLGAIMGRVRQALLALVFLTALVSASPAGAQTYVGVTPPQLGSADIATTSAATASAPVPSASASLAQTAPAPVQRLAFSGADIMGMLVLAGFCIGIGTLLRGAGHQSKS